MISLLLDEPMPGEEGEGPLFKTITGSGFQLQCEEEEASSYSFFFFFFDWHLIGQSYHYIVSNFLRL